jgi:serine phosphatase RsbU (regulator of sigma subunit)
MEVQIAVSKTRKYATSLSGDTVEVIERPNGGVSVVIADGQSSGKGAKTISNLVTRKIITLLSEGVRDGAAARAASDALLTEKKGKVSATLNIVSIDLLTRTIVITRNNPMPVVVASNTQISLLDEVSKPIGIFRDTRPVISEIAIAPDLFVVTFTDGLLHAGSRTGDTIDLVGYLEALLESEDPSPQWIADSLLNCAVELDDGRPQDDITVAVVRISPRECDEIRRMTVNFPISLP